jgi:putative RNA methylase family UPF0020
MKQMIDIDLFNNDERIVINKIAENTRFQDLDIDMVISNINFARSISTEQDIIELYDGILSVLSRVSADEWNALKNKIPFEVYYDEESTSDFEEEIEVS